MRRLNKKLINVETQKFEENGFRLKLMVIFAGSRTTSRRDFKPKGLQAEN